MRLPISQRDGRATPDLIRGSAIQIPQRCGVWITRIREGFAKLAAVIPDAVQHASDAPQIRDPCAMELDPVSAPHHGACPPAALRADRGVLRRARDDVLSQTSAKPSHAQVMTGRERRTIPSICKSR
jgi:hypothetical protein